MPVGETRPTADFYVSADLTRTSERRLQAGKILGFEVLSSRFPYYIFGLKSGRTQDAITDSMAHVHGTARQLPAASMAVAAVPLMLAAAEKVPVRNGDSHSRSTTLSARPPGT